MKVYDGFADKRTQRAEELVNRLSVSAPSPLESFRLRDDHRGVSRSPGNTLGLIKKTKRKLKPLHDQNQWLQPDKLDPEFGTQGATQEQYIRRTYRRLQSSALFSPIIGKEVGLSQLDKLKTHHDNFILVEESRLPELQKLERLLREEKSLLGQQCNIVLANDSSVLDTRVPLLATRVAVRSACEEQMRQSTMDIMHLQAEWDLLVKENQYTKAHLFLNDSYVKCAPSAQKAMKLRLVREASENWELQKDRDTMQYEDELSYHNGKYHTAMIRQRDYERYFVLASRYNPMSEEEYHYDDRPGRRYMIRSLEGTKKFQHLWARYWAVRSLKRVKAAKLIQKYGRMYPIKRRLLPIIRIRMKIGKRAYYMFCLFQWLSYNRICKNIREMLLYHKYHWIRICYNAWKGWARQKAERTEVILRKFRNQFGTQGGLYYTFRKWLNYIKRNRYILQKARRILQNPHFGMWVEFTDWRKHIKRLNKAASYLQLLFKARHQRLLFLKMKEKTKVLRYLWMICKARRKVYDMRTTKFEKEWTVWWTEEKKKRNHRSNEAERMRLMRRQALVQEQEKSAISAIKKHIQSRDGQTQIHLMVWERLHQKPLPKHHGAHTVKATEKDVLRGKQEEEEEAKRRAFKRLSRDQQNAAVQAELLQECLEFNREIHTHDYDCRYPCYLQCPHPHCRAIFTMEDQYHTHMGTDTLCSTKRDSESYDGLHARLDVTFTPMEMDEEEDMDMLDDEGSVVTEGSLDERIREGSLVLETIESIEMGSVERGIGTGIGTGIGKKKKKKKKQRKRDMDTNYFPFSMLHMMLLHDEGKDYLRSILLNILPVRELHSRMHDDGDVSSGLENCIDAWHAVQDFKKTLHTKHDFERKAIRIYDHFIADNAPQATGLEFDSRSALIDKIALLRVHKNKGFYEEVASPQGMIRNLLGISAPTYVRWTTNAIANVSLFDELEWHCFFALYNAIDSHRQAFATSEEFNIFIELYTLDVEERDSAVVTKYKGVKRADLMDWAREFREHEVQIAKTATEAAYWVLITTALVDDLLEDAVMYGAIAQRRREDAELRERIKKSVEVTMDLAIEAMYERLVPLVPDKLLSIPECKKGVRKYAGIVDPPVDPKAAKAAPPVVLEPLPPGWFNRWCEEVCENDENRMYDPKVRSKYDLRKSFIGQLEDMLNDDPLGLGEGELLTFME